MAGLTLDAVKDFIDDKHVRFYFDESFFHSLTILIQISEMQAIKANNKTKESI